MNQPDISSDMMDMLPDEIVDMLKHEEVSKVEQLEALGIALSEKRSEAVSGRLESGIETIWLECEEAYLGIDDMNRHEFAGARWAKPTTMEGPVTTGARTGDGNRSTVYPRLTSRYVDAGASKLGEILLPIDDKAFSFEPTIVQDKTAQPEAMPQMPMGMPQGAPQAGIPPAMPGMPQEGMPQAPVAPAKDPAYEHAKECAKKAEKRIWDWMMECGHASEVRKVIHDAARLGVGILKAPYPDVQTSKAYRNGSLEVISKVVPKSKWVDPWNCFPDPSCGENIQAGDYFWERDFISPRTLKGLRKHDGYLKDQINKVLKEGPGKCNTEGRNPNEKEKKHSFEIWYFYGAVSRKDLELAQATGLDSIPEDMEDIYAIVSIVNDTVIKAVINPLESGDFPYHNVPWQRRSGHWAGVGVGEQVRIPQRMLTAATRGMLNNAGKSAGSQVVIDQGSIIPADGNPYIVPDKLWYKAADSITDDVRKAFAVFQIPNITPQLMSIIEYAMRLAEESTSIPLVTQGQTGPTTPETFGATQMQNNNAMTLLRNIGYSFDDHITVPVVNQYYEYLLLDPSVPDEEKGDFKINAHGSVALVERAMQDQTIFQMGGMVVNPAFGADPKKWFAEFLKTKRLDPRSIQYSEEDQAKMAQQPPPPPPQIQAAQIRAESDAKKVQAQIQADMQKSQAEMALEREIAQMEHATMQTRIKVDTDRDTAFVASQSQKNQIDGELRIRELEMKLQIETLKYATQEKISLEDAKVQLARDSMKLSVTKELAGMKASADMMPKPPIEPQGRAAPGHSYEQ